VDEKLNTRRGKMSAEIAMGDISLSQTKSAKETGSNE
jgi:hypothetical protein